MLTETSNQQELISSLNSIEKELKGIKKKGAKQVFDMVIAIVITLAIAITTGFFCGQHWDEIKFKLFPNAYSSSTTVVLEEKLSKQAKLNTGIYSQTTTYDSGKLYNNKVAKKLRINSKSMKFTYTGYVEAGIKDLSKVKVNVNSKTNVITIDNIKIEITNVYIDPSSITDTNQSKNIFNQLTIDDFTSSQKELQEKIIKDAKKSGVLEEAKESAEETLTNIFGESVQGYTVEFNWK